MTSNEILNAIDSNSASTNDAILSLKEYEQNLKILNTHEIQHVGKLKPIKTRRFMSKFEFAGAITKLAQYLDTLSSLDQYVDAVEINGFINNSELAYKLLMNHVFDIIIDREGYEQVSFSELKINPAWCTSLENYFKRNYESLCKNCYEPYGNALDVLLKKQNYKKV